MNPLQKLLTKYQLPIFFLFSYVLSWWSLPLLRGLLPHGVAIAAIIIIAISAGKPGLHAFWNRLKNFRLGWLFLAAPAIIVVFKLGDSISNFLAGATLVGLPHVPFAPLAVELLLLGGLWEEPGWSGYALPMLQKRFAKGKYGIVIATLIVGILRGFWHVPLVIVGAIPWYDAIWFTPFVYQPFISWLFNKSRGSVLLVMFFHYMSNLLFALSPVFTGANKPMYTIFYMAFGGLLTLVLILTTRFKLGWREDAFSGIKTVTR